MVGSAWLAHLLAAHIPHAAVAADLPSAIGTFLAAVPDAPT